MSEKKKIDRLFQEQFRDFEVTPEEKVWENIEARLAEKKKRRIIPIWWKLSGVAAALVIGLLVYNRFSGDGPGTIPSTPDQPVVSTENNNSGANNRPSGTSTDRLNGSGNNPSANPSENGTILPNASVNKENTAVANSENNNPQGTGNENKSGLSNPVKTNQSVAVSGSSSENKTNGGKRGKQPLHKPSKGKTNVLGNTDAQTAVAATNQNDHKTQKGLNANEKTTQNNNTVAPNQGIAANDNGRNADRPDPLQAIQPNSGQNPKGQSQNTTTNPKDVTPNSTTGIANNTDVKKDSTGVATLVPNALEELLNEKENNVTTKEPKVNRWQITSNVAPIYFSSASNGSPLDSRFEGNKKTYTTSLSYGMGAKYALNKKFSIKSGVNAVALEYNTSDVVFFQTDNARRIKNVTPNMAGAFIQVDNKPENNAVTTLARARNQYSGDVNQKIGYVEVPVEMTYKVFDKKFGMEVIGGLSTLFLNRNEVSIVSPGLEMAIGEANNLNTVHFSTNVGVGFKYNFLKSFQTNVEPMLKYQINTFSSDAGNFKPFFFGLYTGVSYRF